MGVHVLAKPSQQIWDNRLNFTLGGAAPSAHSKHEKHHQRAQAELKPTYTHSEANYTDYLANYYAQERRASIGQVRNRRPANNPSEIALNSNLDLLSTLNSSSGNSEEDNYKFLKAQLNRNQLVALRSIKIFIGDPKFDTKSKKLNEISSLLSTAMPIVDNNLACLILKELKRAEIKLDENTEEAYQKLLSRSFFLRIFKKLPKNPASNEIGVFLEIFKELMDLKIDKRIISERVIDKYCKRFLGSKYLTEGHIYIFIGSIEIYPKEFFPSKIDQLLFQAIKSNNIKLSKKTIVALCLTCALILDEKKASDSSLIIALSKKIQRLSDFNLDDIASSTLLLRFMSPSLEAKKFYKFLIDESKREGIKYSEELIKDHGEECVKVGTISHLLLAASRMTEELVTEDLITLINDQLKDFDFKMNIAQVISLADSIRGIPVSSVNQDLMKFLEQKIKLIDSDISIDKFSLLVFKLALLDTKLISNSMLETVSSMAESFGDDFQQQEDLVALFYFAREKYELDAYPQYMDLLIGRLDRINQPIGFHLIAAVSAAAFIGLGPARHCELLEKLAKMEKRDPDTVSLGNLDEAFWPLHALNANQIPKGFLDYLLDKLRSCKEDLDMKSKAYILMALKNYDKRLFNQEDLDLLYRKLKLKPGDSNKEGYNDFLLLLEMPGLGFGLEDRARFGIADNKIEHTEDDNCSDYIRLIMKSISIKKPKGVLNFLIKRVKSQFAVPGIEYVRYLQKHKPEIKTLDDLADFVWGEES